MAKQQAEMLTHDQIWGAMDRLAERAGLSPSGLAKKSGLDPTTFNKSKRITPEGRPRWPSTESVAKALAATDVPFDTFISLIEDAPRVVQSVPLLGFAQAGAGGYFTDGGFPAGKGWDEVGLPSVNDEHAYALEISGDSMKPAYRDGDVIVVSPGAQIRKGDRVVVKTSGRRGDGQGTEAPHRQDAGVEFAQPQSRRPHAGGGRRRLDREDRVGEPVRFCRPGEGREPISPDHVARSGCSAARRSSRRGALQIRVPVDLRRGPGSRVQRSGMKNAASRPGHELTRIAGLSNSHASSRSRAAARVELVRFPSR